MDVLLVLAKVAIVVGLGAFAVLTGGRIVLAVFALAERRIARTRAAKPPTRGSRFRRTARPGKPRKPMSPRR
ncbi:MAG: hypothetical protein IPL43_10185 [Micropruina sp.]|nr:hypothetical protein [Micropruina sp.]